MIRGLCTALAVALTLFALLAACLWPPLLWANACAGLAWLTCQMALLVFLMRKHE